MFALPNPWLILAAVLAIGAAGLAGDLHGAKRGRDEVQVQWDKENAQVALRSAENVQRTRDTEEKLRKGQEEQRKRDAEAFAALDDRLRAVNLELSNRPKRPAPSTAGGGDTAGSGPARGCTGAGLYADDGMLLAGKADLFQRIRIQRDTCYARYSEAQTEVKRLRGVPSDDLATPNAAMK